MISLLGKKIKHRNDIFVRKKTKPEDEHLTKLIIDSEIQ